MITVLYAGCLFICAIALVYMAQKNYNNIDIYHWTILILIPIIIMAYWLKSQVTTPEASSVLMCFQYFDSTFLFCALLFYTLHNIGINAKPWMKILLYGLAFIHMMIVCLCFNTGLYYSSIEVTESPMGNYTSVKGGPLMVLHYAYLAILLAIIVMLIVLCIRKRGSYSMTNIAVYLAVPIACFAMYIAEGLIGGHYTMLPVLYTVADVIIAASYDRAHAHDIAFLIADHNKSDDERGYVAIGLGGNYLSSNQRGLELLPFLNKVKVNEKFPEDDEIADVIDHLIRAFERDNVTSARYNLGDRICVCDISYFSIRAEGSRQGYLLDIRDATEEQKAYDLIRNYNKVLNEEVDEKTKNIRGMQRKLVLGMADMIENRDDNTGGHVKRTSDIISIIVDEIKRQGNMDISDQMAEDIVRAAPTHDLGKITIDNSILNKPGRFTDDEYEIMKTHSTKSGEMVMILLDGVEEERFVKVAYNVARYHHERWDGRGYPEGLVGTMIPLEARIMAVADVYDALVSKRVYKEPMSFEKSASIMCECMGTQFDPNMKSVFLGCRERLEQYYIENDR